MLIYRWWCTKRNVVTNFTIHDTIWRSNHEISIHMIWYAFIVNDDDTPMIQLGGVWQMNPIQCEMKFGYFRTWCCSFWRFCTHPALSPYRCRNLAISHRTPNSTTVTTLWINVLRIGSRLVFCYVRRRRLGLRQRLCRQLSCSLRYICISLHFLV